MLFKVQAFGRIFHVTPQDLTHLQHEGLVTITSASGVNLADFSQGLQRTLNNAGLPEKEN